jgi:hypothetical protein
MGGGDVALRATAAYPSGLSQSKLYCLFRFATVEALFIFRCGLQSESLQEHLPEALPGSFGFALSKIPPLGGLRV